MAITGIPTFEDGEIPSAAKLNLLGGAISTKFGGAIGPGDMAWPFIVEGNIDFDQTWAIVGLRTFWNIINAAEYDTLDEAVTAAEDAGGSAVLIPPSHTVTTGDGVDIDTSGITIMGCGHTSVIQMTTGTSGYMLRTGSGSLSDITIENLTLDGASNDTGGAQLGVQVRRVTGFTMRNVLMKNFTGNALEITHDGTPGNSCVDAKVLGCRFTGGGVSHIKVVDVDGLIIADMKSSACADIAIAMEPGSSSGLLKRITLASIDIDTPGGVGVSILAGDSTADAKWSIIALRGVTVSAAAADGFNIGASSKPLKYVTMVGCAAPEATANGMTMEVEDSHIVGNFFPDAQGDTGIDMLASESTVVTNNNVTGSAGDGIDCSGTTDCRVGNNDVSGFAGGSLGLVKIGATTLRAWDNIGDVLGIGSTFVDLDVHTAAGGADEVVFTLTIPGNTLTKKGDSIHVRIFGDCDGTSTLGSGDIKFAGTSLMTIVLRGPFNESEYAVDVWIVLDADDGNIDATALSMNRDDLSYAPQGSAVTVDMGVDQNITVNLHGGDTNSASLLKFFLEVSKGTD